MTAEERERMNELCRFIGVEKDPKKFLALVEDLNELLEQKEARLTGAAKTGKIPDSD